MALTYDVTLAPWYDLTKAAIVNLATLKAYFADLDRSTLDDATMQQLQDYKFQLEQMVEVEAKTAVDFFAVRDADIANVRALFDAFKIARAAQWQIAEDNGMVVADGPAAVTQVVFT